MLVSGDKGLNETFDVSYSMEPQTINFYAVYKKYEFSYVFDGVDKYTVELSLPNDANGNSYTNDDVKFVKVLKSQYDSDVYAKFNTVDKLNAILSSGSLIASSTFVAEGPVLKLSEVASEYYVFAVVQRKVDGINIIAFYIAMRIDITN